MRYNTTRKDFAMTKAVKIALAVVIFFAIGEGINCFIESQIHQCTVDHAVTYEELKAHDREVGYPRSDYAEKVYGVPTEL